MSASVIFKVFAGSVPGPAGHWISRACCQWFAENIYVEVCQAESSWESTEK